MTYKTSGMIKISDVCAATFDSRIQDISADLRMFSGHFRDIAVCADKKAVCFRKVCVLPLSYRNSCVWIYIHIYIYIYIYIDKQIIRYRFNLSYSAPCIPISLSLSLSLSIYIYVYVYIYIYISIYIYIYIDYCL